MRFNSDSQRRAVFANMNKFALRNFKPDIKPVLITKMTDLERKDSDLATKFPNVIDTIEAADRKQSFERMTLSDDAVMRKRRKDDARIRRLERYGDELAKSARESKMNDEIFDSEFTTADTDGNKHISDYIKTEDYSKPDQDPAVAKRIRDMEDEGGARFGISFGDSDEFDVQTTEHLTPVEFVDTSIIDDSVDRSFLRTAVDDEILKDVDSAGISREDFFDNVETFRQERVDAAELRKMELMDKRGRR